MKKKPPGRRPALSLVARTLRELGRRDREEHPGILQQGRVVEVGALDHAGDLEVAGEAAVLGDGAAVDEADGEGLAAVERDGQFGLAGQCVEGLLLCLALARGLLLKLLHGTLFGSAHLPPRLFFGVDELVLVGVRWRRGTCLAMRRQADSGELFGTKILNVGAQDPQAVLFGILRVEFVLGLRPHVFQLFLGAREDRRVVLGVLADQL